MMGNHQIMNTSFATGNDYNPFLSVYRSFGESEIDYLVVCHFGEINNVFKQSIYSFVMVETESQETGT